MLRNRSAAGIIALLLGLIWSVFIFLDYLAHHPDLSRALVQPPYLGLLVFIALLAGGSSYYAANKLKKSKNKSWVLGYRGISAYGLLALFSAILLGAFVLKTGMDDPGLAIRIPYFTILSTVFGVGFLLILTIAYAYGNLWLEPLRNRYHRADYSLISIALGFGTLAFLLTIFGLLGGGAMTYSAWFFAIAILGWQWKPALAFVKNLVWTKHEFVVQKAWTPAIIVSLLSVLAINWVGAFKLFPIGYDGGSLYVNLAEITANRGELPAGGQAFAWSVIMSLGETLFFSRTAVILLANGMGFLLLYVLYRLGRHFLSPAYGRLSVLLTASLPYFGFQALVEEKVDFGLSYVLLCLLLLAIPRLVEKKEEGPIKLFGRFALTPLMYGFILAGWLVGFAFSIKYTSILFVLSLASWGLYKMGGRYAFYGGCALALALVFGGGIYQFGYLQFDSNSQPLLLGAASLVAGISLLWLAFRDQRRLLPLYFRGSVALLAAAAIAFLPWSVKHLSENGSFSLSHLIEGRSAQPEINQSAPWSSLLQDGLEDNQGLGRVLQAGSLNTLTSDGIHNPFPKIHLAFQSSRPFGSTDDGGRYEELQRYLGYEQGLGLYLSLPYDVAMNTNISGSRYVELGFLFMLFFPLLLFLGRPSFKRLLIVGLPAFGLAMIWLGLSTVSVYAPDGNWDASLATQSMEVLFAAQPSGDGSLLHSLYAVFWSVVSGLAGTLAPVYRAGMEMGTLGSMVVLLILSAGIGALLRPRLAHMDTETKALGGFAFIYLLLWWMLGNGIVWYAMPVFVLLPILIVHHLEKPKSLEGKDLANSSRWLMSALLGLAVVLNIAYYYTSSFPTDIENKEGLFRWPFVEYMSNPSASDSDIYEYFNPVLDDVVRTLNTNEDALVYRVNTFYGFLIENNDQRVFSDPTLDKFNYLTSRMSDQSEFFDLLQEEGFEYILLDLRMHLTDQTPEKTLTAKYIRLADLLLRSENVRLLHTDNYIANPNGRQIRTPSGQLVNASQGLRGQTVSLGTMALFQLVGQNGR
ncbi:MAG: hypothetical protein AAGF87_10135 [Bacteroidota bacterium]